MESAKTKKLFPEKLNAPIKITGNHIQRTMNGTNSSVENTKGCSIAASLRFVRMNENANAPTYGSANAAGADLCSAENCVVPPHGRLLVSTGLQVAVPPGHYGRVAPRSGLAVKHFIDVGAGVVDEDYRGELKVLLFNFGDAEFQVKVGDRIAQFICEKCTPAELVEVDSLDETARGAGGFGSTGINNKIA